MFSQKRYGSAARRLLTLSLMVLLLGSALPRMAAAAQQAAVLEAPTRTTAKPVPAGSTVKVGPILGAPVRWGLRQRVAEALRQYGLRPAAARTGRPTYDLRGKVTSRVGRDGTRQVVVHWWIYDRRGRIVSTMMHMAAVPLDMLRGRADEPMDSLAAETADNIWRSLPADPLAALVAVHGLVASADDKPDRNRRQATRQVAQNADAAKTANSLIQTVAARTAPSRKDIGSTGRARTVKTAGDATAAAQWWIQVGSHKNKAVSLREWQKLRTASPRLLANVPHAIRRSRLRGKGVFYRIQIGPYASARAADRFCKSLKATGVSCFLARHKPSGTEATVRRTGDSRVTTLTTAGRPASRGRSQGQPVSEKTGLMGTFRGLPGLDD